MARFLVTGGAGFIGSHVVDALLARGDYVRVLDDASTGDLANLTGAQQHHRCEVMLGSVCDQLLVDEACQGVDAVIHLAAAVGVQRILDRRIGSIVTNLRGTEIVLAAAAAAGGLPVFIASSSEVYGKSAKVPFREGDDSVLGPSETHRWSYACAKAMDEFLALAWHHERDLPITIGRFFNVTGPRQTGAYGMVLPRFCQAAVAGDSLRVYGDGEQTRCFLHVADCVSAVIALLESSAAIGQVVNIGGSEEVSIGDLATRVINAAGSGQVQAISYSEAYPGGGFEDLRRRVPDVAKLRELTGWRQQFDLDTVINACLEDARARL